MAKFFNITFVVLTLINFLSLFGIYLLYSSNDPNPEPFEMNGDKMVTVTLYDGSLLAGWKLDRPMLSREIVAFLGVPYARPPVGERRFRAPEPLVQSMHSIHYAYRWPNPCMQPDQHLQLHNRNFSEDCLYLNVWTPMPAMTAGANLPVIVVIHTGAFVFGSASETKYDGRYLAAYADAVVVTFNYRLNFYGFYYHQQQYYQRNGSENFEPNVGMLDQVAALQWIQRNIRQFGGHPDYVTLVGQSSGGLAVGMHLLSPLSRGLFSRAMMLSGSPWQLPTEPDIVDEFWNNYAYSLQCGGHENVPQCIHEQIVKNRNSLLTMERVKKMGMDGLFVNVPVVEDGYFLPGDPFRLVEELSSPLNVSIVYGYTDDEGSWIAMLDDGRMFGPRVEPSLTRSAAINVANRFLDRMLTTYPIDKSKIIRHYLGETEISSSDISSNIWQRMVTNILADRYITCPAELFAAAIRNKTTGGFFQYQWQYKGNPGTSSFWNTFSHVWCGPWMGSCHSFETYALFGIPFLEPGIFDHNDRIVSLETLSIIQYFARTGNLFWPSITENRTIYYKVDRELERFTFGHNLKLAECRKIWAQYLLP